MTSITSKAKFRQRVIRYSEKYGVTAASIRHRVTRKTIYDWKKKYDGHWKSLRDGSHRPHSHPNQHTAEENALIMHYFARNKEDKMVLWDKIRKQGYTRPYKSMVRALKRLVVAEEITKRNKYNPKPYKRADYPGQKVQVDVKFVASYCVANGQKYYQYAERLLKNLSSKNYLAEKGANNGYVLMHSTGSLPHGSEIDTPINYADYYYLEALKRYMDMQK